MKAAKLVRPALIAGVLVVSITARAEAETAMDVFKEWGSRMADAAKVESGTERQNKMNTLTANAADRLTRVECHRADDAPKAGDWMRSMLKTYDLKIDVSFRVDCDYDRKKLKVAELKITKFKYDR